MATKSILKPITVLKRRDVARFVYALEKCEQAKNNASDIQGKKMQTIPPEQIADFFGKEKRA